MITINKKINLRIGAKDALKALNELTGWEEAGKKKGLQKHREKS